MADKAEFLQAIDDAILDADSLEKFINGSDSETVLTRLSAEYPTLKKAIKELFENGGLPATPFATKALMMASALVDGKYAQVTDDAVNNGLYIKTAGAWIKSAYDPVFTSNIYSDERVNDLKQRIIDEPPNLLDLSSVLRGQYIYPDGSIKPEASNPSGYAVTQKIPAKPNQYYGFTSESNNSATFYNVVFYDINDNLLSRTLTASPSNGEWNKYIQAPANTYYLRASIITAALTKKLMIFEGQAKIAYSPYSELATLKNLTLSDSMMEDVVNSVEERLPKNIKSKKFNYSGDIYKPFFASQGFDYNNMESSAFKSNDMYALYNTLVSQHSDYITKTSLENDALGNEMAYYTLSQKITDPLTNKNTPKPKIMLNCNIHGFERLSAVNGYILALQLCKNFRDNDAYGILRRDVDIVIMPVANPSGFNAKTYGNSNGVNIELNFPNDFIVRNTGADNYSGATPLSEPETRNIVKMIGDQERVDAFYDIHSFAGQSGSSSIVWTYGNATNADIIDPMGVQLINTLSHKWQSEYSWLPQDDSVFFGSAYSGGLAGQTPKTYADSLGIEVSAVLEVGEILWLRPDHSKYDETHTKLAHETLVNWLLVTLQYFS